MKKILVLQFSDGLSQQQAQACFRSICPQVDFVFLHAVEHDCSAVDMEDFSGLIIGGSGNFYLSKGDGVHSWLPRIFALLDKALTVDKPILGICFGFQILAMHQGASIRQIPDAQEVGTYMTCIVSNAVTDPLFSSMPARFMAQLIHRDVACDFPQQCIPLAYSDKVSCSAFRIEGKKAWGVLFHPELDAFRMKERLNLFPEYVPTGARPEDIVFESPETKRVLSIFTGM